MNEQMSRDDLAKFLGASPSRQGWKKPLPLAAAGAVLLLLIFLVSSWLGSDGGPAYITQEVRRGNLSVTVAATGNLAPTNQVQVGSELSGRIDRVLVDVNDRVAKGQPLAEINTDILDAQIRQSRASLAARRASVAQARATLAESNASLSRLKEVSRLSGGKVPSQTEMETAEAEQARAAAQLKSAEADVAAADAQLSSNLTNRSKAIIRAPVAGVVLSRQIEPGQTVAASFNTPTLFIIAEDLTSMQLEVAIDEADVGQVDRGQKAIFTVDAFPGETFPAEIERVDLGSNNIAAGTAGNAASTASSVVAYDAILRVENPEGRLRPGMTATAEIKVKDVRGALLVPNSALRFSPQQPVAGSPARGFVSTLTPRPRRGRRGREPQQREIGAGSRQTVYVVGEDGQPQPVEVVTQSSDGRNTAVRSDELEPGMKVVVGVQAMPE
jgi:HlyD family secretion protein